jgi:tetratricopeptide (TPR) repeat protein
VDELIGKRLGEFEVVRELGRGGMGVVFEAVQTSLNRRVALKVLGAGLGLTPRAVARFRREAGAAAKLHHTNIVPVYATGEEGGFHFYAMELIEGPALDRVIAGLRPGAGPAPALAPELAATGPYLDAATPTGSVAPGLSSGGAYFDTVARLVADVAEALQHAHTNGVIHRDIKPGNLLLGADGRLSVNDFGLARALEEPGMTTTGEFVGTPAYMAPEQIAGGRIPVDHRCDIYSLGATLYELLTLRPPFVADRRDQLLALVVQKEPPAPRSVNPQVPRDLETICLKCLEKDPDRRYRTAQELADDLRRYLNRFAIEAKRTGALGRAKKWVKRNPALSGAGLVVLLALSAAGAFAWKARESERQRVADEMKREEELKAEKRRAAIDRGMVAAMAADLTAAQVAVAEAEQFGSSAAELQLLRGFIKLYSGDIAAAIKELRAAAELMPDSVSALALLAVALGQSGDWDEHDRVLKVVRGLPPKTPEERMFLGLALGPMDSTAALPELRAAVHDRPSNIGRVFLADALWMHAANTGTVEDAEAALDAAETALRLLPKNVAVEVIAVNARVAAATAHARAGNPVKSKEHLDAASRLADAFSGPPDRYSLFYTRFIVASVRDGASKPPLPFTAKLAFPTGTKEPDVPALYAIALLRQREVDKARAVPLSPDSAYSTTQLNLMFHLERSDGRASARATWAGFIEPKYEPVKLLEFIPWLYLTGEAHRVPEVAARLRASGFRYGATPPADWELVLQYWEGKLSDDAFVDAPTASKNPAIARPQISWRQMIVGMKRLGEGDRAGARRAFTANYEAYNFSYTPWEWCGTFLICMNADPDWPKAIPLKK